MCIRDRAQDELAEAKEELEQLKEKLTILLLPRDPNDSRNVILEIRGGVGGEESALFAHSLLRMYTMYAESRGWKLEIASINETELGGVKEAIFSVDGAGAYNRLKYESGVHRVQRVPETETQGRIHTSAATVAIMPEAEEVDLDLKPEDLRFDVYRSSGPGGQSVNTTDSAVRLTHIPTGIVVTCQNEKSQLQNKEAAFRVLRGKLYEREEQARAAELAELKGEKMDNSFGSQIRNYVLYPYRLIKDTRSNIESGNVDAALDGEIDQFVIGYHRWRASQ